MAKIFDNILLRLRAFYYLQRKGDIPADVRSYVLLKNINVLKRYENALSPQKQEELATLELNALMNYDMSLEAKNEIATDILKRLGKIPTVHCSICDHPILAHNAIKKDERIFCKECFNDSLAG